MGDAISPRVLVVDDEPQVAASVEDILEDHFEVFVFTEATEALDFIDQNRKLSVILSDQRMPKLPGDEFLKCAGEKTSAIKLLMTGFADLDSVIRAVNHGHIYGYLSKPWEPAGLQLMVKQAVEHHRLQQNLTEERNLLHLILNSIPDYIYFKDANLTFERINKALANFLKIQKPEDAQGKRLHEFLDFDLAEDFEAEEIEILRTGIPMHNKIKKLVSSENKKIWVTSTAVPVNAGDGSLKGIIGITRDITEHQNLVTNLEEARQMEQHLSRHDPLTKLPNSCYFNNLVDQTLGAALKDGFEVSVFLLSIGRLKSVNRALGYQAGDEILIAVANRLTELFEQTNRISRFTGDEFAVMLEGYGHSELRKIAAETLKKLAQPYDINAHEVSLGFSLGISTFPDDGESSETLIKRASKAMNAAKRQDDSSYKFYSELNDFDKDESLHLEKALRSAIANDELVLFYQPQISRRGLRISGAEALIRWQHPQLGMISPGRFIGLAEDTGLILPMGEWILKTACIQARKWQKLGLDDFRISVNLSPRQFRANDLNEVIIKALTSAKLKSSSLVVEITEGSAMQNVEHTIMVLKTLRDAGIQVAIDDFGTGYASLNYLKRLPLDIMKIDRSFVNQIHECDKDQAIVSAMTHMAHKLGLKVLAEGVENIEQFSYLNLLECNEYQGFHFSRPMPAADFEAYMMTRN